jgi:hypothetical protein
MAKAKNTTPSYMGLVLLGRRNMGCTFCNSIQTHCRGWAEVQENPQQHQALIRKGKRKIRDKYILPVFTKMKTGRIYYSGSMYKNKKIPNDTTVPMLR